MGSMKERETQNIISLFSDRRKTDLVSEFEEILIEDSHYEDDLEEAKKMILSVPVVSINEDPYKAIFVLENQIEHLKITSQKMKFYLSELESILPNSLK